jgi:adenine-specific DNA-methyltransferase
MANELQELLKEIKDERLKSRLSAAVAELRKTKKFGLVFEEHLPELLPIYSAKVRSQARVARRNGRLTETFIVQRVARGVATVIPEAGGSELQTIPVAELVVIKRFGEAIFPALRHVESVLRGGDAPHHTLIEADNYHALQLLEWLYAGKVDCIYIDPPYNSGARDWKYNNDYVDGNDAWRHSKWLAFMERRLRLAKRLLNPRASALIVTIDEKEFSHLGLLLEQTFPEATIQMISSVINPKGVGRANEFSRTNEFIFMVWFGAATINPVEHTGRDKRDVEWQTFRRRDLASARGTKKGGPAQFYPIYVGTASGRIEEVGEPLPHNVARESAPKRARCVSVFPIRPDGTEMNWAVTAPTFRERLAKGYARAGKHTGEPQPYIIQYLKSGPIDDIESGRVSAIGHNPDGSVIAVYEDNTKRTPTTQWNFGTHYAEHYGTKLLKDIVPNCEFPFPKSVYAVRDALGCFVANAPNALIVDFFSGSGTTLNAVTLLNAADGGRRRCILVTNNEVSADEADILRARHHQPGDAQWEKRGICRSITFPRCKFAIGGRRDDGTQLTGEYLIGRLEKQEGRRAIRSLDFATVEALKRKRAREALAVAVGFPKSKVTEGESFLLSEGESTAVLLDPDALDKFIEQGEEWAEGIETIYLPFPSGGAFNLAKQQVIEAWPPLIKTVEMKRPMKDGFAANLDYFRLDFLDRSMVESVGNLADILPALWMMAGCRGELPPCKGNEKMLFFKDCPFAVLVEEGSIKRFLAKLEERRDVDWVFLVTNDQDSFSRMCEWLPEHIPAAQRVHLWRNYVDNFLINVDHGSAGDTP